MNTSCFRRPSALIGVVCIGVTNLSLGTVGAQAEEAKTAAPQVVLAETYNAVTRIYFTNPAVHKGSSLVERRFRADARRGVPDLARGKISEADAH